ncbi:MAG: hypothetical protein OEV91_03255 [Desulfobulbaceae bacterium]|nr:hypothetical protein [Desulfobulbaceae bacterium]
MQPLHVKHLLLADGPDFDTCRQRVEHFFARTILVKYDTVRVVAADSHAGDDPRFWPALEQGVAANRAFLAELLSDLAEAGVRSASDLATLPQGYASKTLHTIAHLLDGFIGIDSRFYNLSADSHWLPDRQRQQIEADPAHHWLISVEASSAAGDADRVFTLRTIPTARG